MMRRATESRFRLLGPGIFAGVFVLCNLVVAHYRPRLLEQHAAQLLANTAPTVSDVPRYDATIGEDVGRYWRYLPDARRTRLIIVVGMSQMYSINEPKPDEKIVAEWIDERVASKGAHAFGLAAPNLNNEEALLYLLATASDATTHPDAMIYGVCFDKFRNVDLRPGLMRFVRERPNLSRVWRDIAERYRDKYPRAAAKMLATLRDVADSADKGTEADFEQRVRQAAGSVLPLVDARSLLNGQVQGALYRLRNWIFGIKASTKRPIIGARYQLNQELLDLLADEAARSNVKLMPYIIPVNPTAETPYVAQEYKAFRTWMVGFAQRHGLRLADFSDLVPAEEWGSRGGEPDFKHFMGPAHKRTADAVVDFFAAELSITAAPAAP